MEYLRILEKYGFNEYKNKVINYIKEKCSTDENVFDDNINVNMWLMEVPFLGKEYIVKIDSTIEIEMLNEVFNNFMNEITLIFHTIENFYFNEYLINENEVSEKIDYNLSLKDFYNNLKEIKIKYSKLDILKKEFEKELDDEIKKYKKYNCYDNVKRNIELCKKSILNKINLDNYNLREYLILDMNKSIIDIFDTFYSNLEQNKNVYSDLLLEIIEEDLIDQNSNKSR